ncbi:MAG TPA: archease [Gaiellaceae bacterium]|nr:archease [Gaiellaceae bacterium]
MYRFVDHTSELELELEAGSPEEALVEAMRAFAELTGPGDGERVERRVEVSAGDLPALLGAWLDELLFLADTEGLVPEEAELAVEGTRASGVLRARRGEPRPLVKAVTLHRLELRRENGRWRGRVVLDV